MLKVNNAYPTLLTCNLSLPSPHLTSKTSWQPHLSLWGTRMSQDATSRLRAKSQKLYLAQASWAKCRSSRHLKIRKEQPIRVTIRISKHLRIGSNPCLRKTPSSKALISRTRRQSQQTQSTRESQTWLLEVVKHLTRQPPWCNNSIHDSRATKTTINLARLSMDAPCQSRIICTV